MGSKKEEAEERKIPVLTVMRNNTVLKNIFIVNKPPEESRADHEDVLLVGRHPDCDLMLTHPSISRFHLQIRSKPSSRTFSVVDLSSVHGTWVSGRKIEPMDNVEMKEGDTLRIGVSSRVYRLHWIPVSRAYDLENPFVSQLDVVVEEEEEEEKEEEDKKKNLDCCVAERKEIESVDSGIEDISSLFLDENVELTVEEEIPLAAGVVEEMVALCYEKEKKSSSKEKANGIPNDLFGIETSDLPTISDGEHKLCDSLNQVLALPHVELVEECDETSTENLSESACLPAVEAVLGTKEQKFHTTPDKLTSSPLSAALENSFEKHDSSLLMNFSPMIHEEKSAAESVILPTASEAEFSLIDDGRLTYAFPDGIGIFSSENVFLLPEEAMSGTKFQQVKVFEEVVMDSVSDVAKQDMLKKQFQLLNNKFCHEQEHSIDEIVQDNGNKHASSISSTLCQIESVNLLVPHEAVLNFTSQTWQQDMEFLESSVKAMGKNSTNRNVWSRRGKATSAPQIRTSKSLIKSTAKVDSEVAMSNEKAFINKRISKNLFSVLNADVEEEHDEIFTPDKENFSTNTLQLQFLKNGKLGEIKQCKSQRSNNSKDKLNPGIGPNESKGLTLCKKNQKDIINKTMSRNLFSVLDREEEAEEEFFTPDKENISPNTLRLRQLKRKGKVEEIKRSKSPWSQNPEDNIYPDENMSPYSNKENQTPKGVKDQKLERKPLGSHIKLAQDHNVMTTKGRVDRVPLQTLKCSGGRRKLGTSCSVSAAKSFDFSSCGQILDKHINPFDTRVQKKSWDMIVDTTSLVNKESRKALQLLQGLKGTRLIIPRLVIRELNSLKQQYTIFRRTSEASLALEWIEECMVKTNWWIHIQSSGEEQELIAPTPPASPCTNLSEESWTFHGRNGSLQPLAPHNFSMDIASPTVEDHILDFARIYRRKQIDRQLVLLSEDVATKIKYMAEGLLCEPVQEFRESLVNPFSERFLWTNSSPRGQTWSCQDDVVLREKYCPLSLSKPSKGAASGLKLILLNNFQYGH